VHTQRLLGRTLSIAGKSINLAQGLACPTIDFGRLSPFAPDYSLESG
jgi:hypothetical protein